MKETFAKMRRHKCDLTQDFFSPATLMSHDGKAERVFTESEVRAMLNELWNRRERDSNMSTIIRAVEITHLAHRNGIVLGDDHKIKRKADGNI